ncbi:XRE family transcriptional regulator [Sphingomonas sp. AR_OL41]|uniref:helix-turn-helix domain-containing protein n=1 Tax=Sphingomonas sp. AR_OL41 TaxID=3042729 RepID=UPI0024807A21|nr:XRE family transcriptional regulator [Sphingomonas sp. AR_OL41]MDH7973932.1 XRE family transcriptional regulator [Sphingomonas sp. AR_OL41]
MARTRTAPHPATAVLTEGKGPATPSGEPSAPAEIVLDRYRAFIFPNRVREQRRRRGYQKLMALSALLPDIPYIRLSKIERGEVVARADELQRIGRALDVPPRALLSDVAQPGFDIAAWAQPFLDCRPWEQDEDRMAVMLGAALRVRRNNDRTLTIAALDRDYGLPAVILSRIENAQKTLDRWNEATIASLCRLFGVADGDALRRSVAEQYRRGELDGYVTSIADPEARMARTRQRIDELAAELGAGASLARKPKPARGSNAPSTKAVPPAPPPAPAQSDGLVVYGAPLPGGLIANIATDARIDAPRLAGPRAFGLRVCRATLGAGLPASAIVVADPDRAPTVGGLAVIRNDDGYRLVTVTFDRTGATKGYSLAPDLEINLDELDPADIFAVISAVFP